MLNQFHSLYYNIIKLLSNVNYIMPKFKKGTPEAKEYMETLRRNKDYAKLKGNEKLIMTTTSQINIPETMLYIGPQGNQKIIKTLTKSKNITTRDHKPIINFVTNNENRFQIENKGTSKASTTTNITRAIEDRYNLMGQTKNHIFSNSSVRQSELNRLNSLKKPNKKQIDHIESLLDADKNTTSRIDKSMAILKFKQGNKFKSDIDQDKHDEEQRLAYQERQKYIPNDRGKIRRNTKVMFRSPQSLLSPY